MGCANIIVPRDLRAIILLFIIRALGSVPAIRRLADRTRVRRYILLPFRALVFGRAENGMF